MRLSFFLLLVISFVSCSTASPTEAEVKQQVEMWYMQESSGDGAGRWDVNGITVLSVTKDGSRKDVFNTVSAVSGIRHYPPLAEARPDEPFADTIRMALQWNGAKWVTAE